MGIYTKLCACSHDVVEFIYMYLAPWIHDSNVDLPTTIHYMPIVINKQLHVSRFRKVRSRMANCVKTIL